MSRPEMMKMPLMPSGWMGGRLKKKNQAITQQARAAIQTHQRVRRIWARLSARPDAANRPKPSQAFSVVPARLAMKKSGKLARLSGRLKRAALSVLKNEVISPARSKMKPHPHQPSAKMVLDGSNSVSASQTTGMSAPAARKRKSGKGMMKSLAV